MSRAGRNRSRRRRAFVRPRPRAKGEITTVRLSPRARRGSSTTLFSRSTSRLAGSLQIVRPRPSQAPRVGFSTTLRRERLLDPAERIASAPMRDFLKPRAGASLVRVSAAGFCGKLALAADLRLKYAPFDRAARQRANSSADRLPNQEMPLSLTSATIEVRSADLHERPISNHGFQKDSAAASPRPGRGGRRGPQTALDSSARPDNHGW
jgi:hypothetical protein